MFRFTIRDVLWLMVVVALAIGWRTQHARLIQTIKALKAKASEDSLQVEFERAKRLTRMYETARLVPLKAVEVDDIIETVLHDSSPSRANQALNIVPFIGDRQYAVSFLIKIVNERYRWNDSSLPLNAVVCLADMQAVEAIPAVEGLLDFLKNDASLDDEERQVCMKAVDKKLNQLKSRKEQQRKAVQ
jgi:hypothetical protein